MLVPVGGQHGQISNGEVGRARGIPGGLDLPIGDLQNLLELALGLLRDGNPIQCQGILKT